MEEVLGVKYPAGRDGFEDAPYIGSRPEVIARDLCPASGEVLDYIVTASDGRECMRRQGDTLTRSLGLPVL